MNPGRQVVPVKRKKKMRPTLTWRPHVSGLQALSAGWAVSAFSHQPAVTPSHGGFGTWPYLTFRHTPGLLPELDYVPSPHLRSVLTVGLSQAESSCCRSVECL